MKQLLKEALMLSIKAESDDKSSIQRKCPHSAPKKDAMSQV